jgi:ribosome biogenesis GTPase
MSEARGTVITVLRGGCEVVSGDRVQRLKLSGKHAKDEIALAVGDELLFDADKGVVDRVLARRTKLARLRSFGKPREQVIAANADRLAIVVSVASPPFRSGAVDRFLLAAHLGGLAALLVVNKVDLLPPGEALPDEIRVYEAVTELFPVSAETGAGLERLLARLANSTTVLAGHSGVGKSSLVNALRPELRLETGEISAKWDRGRHTTSRSVWVRLPGGAIAIDTPGVREIGSGPIDPALLADVYPDLAPYAAECRFRDCRHGGEPGCAVRAAVAAGKIPAARVQSFRQLREETEPQRQS